MANPRRYLMTAALVPLVFSLAGCATFDWPWSKERVTYATPRNPAVQVLCLWQASTGRDPDGLPCRGFAGQIIFLAGGNAAPLAVEGDVRIYVFDDQGTLEERSKPRMWDFDSGSWNMHLTNSSLGPTYSVFIPYTKPGSEQVTCTVRVRLTPADGPVIFSETASVILPGRKTVDSVEEANAASASRADGHVWITDSNGLVTNSEADVRSLRKTTIPLNPRDRIRDEQNGEIRQVAFGDAPTDGAAADPVQARLERLERLLEQTLARQQALPPADESDVVQAAYESMSPEVDSMPPGMSARIRAGRPPFRGDRNSGSPAGDGVSRPAVTRLLDETHPPSAEVGDDLPPAPQQLPSSGDAEAIPRHPLLEE